MSGSPYVLIVSQDARLQNLATALQSEWISAEVVGSYEDVAQSLDKHPQCVCVLDGALPSELAVRVVHRSRSRARRTVVLAEPEVFSDFSQRDAWAKGIDLCPRHESLEETAMRIRAIMILAGYDLRISEPAAAAPSSGPLSATPGEVIAVFSVKGGVGKTTLAVNLAAGLVTMHQAKPLLIDANLYFGDVPVLLDIAPKRSILDLCDLKEMDTLTLKKVVTEHKSGISVLSSPPDFTTVEMLGTETLVNAISMYRNLFDYVVVDTRASFDEATLQVLDAADRIILVTTPEVGAVYQTARFLAVADALGYKDRILLVLNRAGSGLEVKSVEAHLGGSIAASVVSAGRSVLSAANRGKPVLLEDTDHKEKIARDLAGVVELVRKPMPARSRSRSNGSLGSRVEQLLRSVAL